MGASLVGRLKNKLAAKALPAMIPTLVSALVHPPGWVKLVGPPTSGAECGIVRLIPLDALAAPLKGEVRIPLTLERIEGFIDDRVDGAMALEREDVTMDALAERERTAKPGRNIVSCNAAISGDDDQKARKGKD